MPRHLASSPLHYCDYQMGQSHEFQERTGALSVSGAIFLILELDRSFERMLQVSSAPLRAALVHLGQQTGQRRRWICQTSWIIANRKAVVSPNSSIPFSGPGRPSSASAAGV
jgi:hypothetical protein